MMEPEAPSSASALPPGVLQVRLGPGANCSSAGSAIDVLFYGSVLVGALAVALAAAFPPPEPKKTRRNVEQNVEENVEEPEPKAGEGLDR